MKHILAIDFEDWHQLVQRQISGEAVPASDHLVGQVDETLVLLEESGCRATFFVVGLVAERHPELIRRVAAAGHEIACHSYAHRLVFQLTPDEFRQDTLRAKALLEDIIGRPVGGYRAPAFSIDRASLWAVAMLAGLGFAYDSSIFPIRHPRYGIPGFDPRPSRYEFGNGHSIVEFPPATLAFAGTRLPVAGGGYFRVLPLWMLRRSLRRLERDGEVMVTYFHPYELARAPLDIFGSLKPQNLAQRLAGMRLNLHYNVLRPGLRRKLAALLREHQFTTFREFLDGAQFGPGRRLL